MKLFSLIQNTYEEQGSFHLSLLLADLPHDDCLVTPYYN